MDRPDGWGPSHQTEPRRRWIARPAVLLIAVGMVGLSASAIHYGAPGIAIVLILVLVTIGVIDAIIASYVRPRGPKRAAMPAGQEPLVAVRMLAASAGGGVARRR
jgi:hypothetical protein